MHKEAREELDVRFKLTVLDLAEQFGVTKTCRDFKVPRSSFYRWKKKYDQEGPSGLYRKKPIAHTHPRKTPPEMVEKILELQREYQIEALRIKYYLERYHGINISDSHGWQNIESLWCRQAAQDCSQTRSAYQKVC